MACKKKQCIVYFVTVRGNLNGGHENRVCCTSSSPLSTLSCLLRKKSVTIGIQIEKRCVWRQVAADHGWEPILFGPDSFGGNEPETGLGSIKGLQHKWRTINTWLFCFLAFITENSSLEPLLEGLFAQIHIDLSWRVFGRNGTGTYRWPKLIQSRALLHWAMVTGSWLTILQDPLYLILWHFWGKFYSVRSILRPRMEKSVPHKNQS